MTFGCSQENSTCVCRISNGDCTFTKFCPYKYDVEQQKKIDTVQQLKIESGYGIMDCRKALEKFDFNVSQAKYYLEIRHLAVTRKRPDGSLWIEQDFINHVKEMIKW